MKATGVTRPIDNLGRVVIPVEILRANNWAQGVDRVEIFTEANTVILRKYQPGCTFCGSMDALVEFGGQHICGACRSKMFIGLKE
jgi:transcriptional pleiotropic regulator of transition state genes